MSAACDRHAPKNGQTFDQFYNPMNSLKDWHSCKNMSDLQQPHKHPLGSAAQPNEAEGGSVSWDLLWNVCARFISKPRDGQT
ncbi:hypothetical protein EXN66_Car019892 [Channa argus]|uniref:Uncharacterized protein n=1 Tax=Channa argus TaxID=215402 RepID=A0A6G1QPI4_CHAAH|nr:hypothetical protein EXN66_Car019892 [Channa argus]